MATTPSLCPIWNFAMSFLACCSSLSSKATLSCSAYRHTLLATRRATSDMESSLYVSLEWRLVLVLTNGVGDRDLDLDLGDLEGSLGGGFGGLGGGVYPRLGAEGRVSRGSSAGSSRQIITLAGDGTGVGGGWRGGGGGGAEEVAAGVLPSCSVMATISCKQMQLQLTSSQFSSPKLSQQLHSSGLFLGGILFLRGACWAVVRWRGAGWD